ncbi:MAG: M23 family metallopeptidase, partial [Oscillospiraceae bacterium]|nr:M23 family metallopeptidase [Oscillospiraceae bacterium]
GTAVYAALSGKVVVSEDTAVGYGRYIIIDHGNGMQTLYGHMLARFAYVGDYVSRGQIIGQVGSTGNSTGPHLHFEVRINDERVPTEPYLGLS